MFNKINTNVKLYLLANSFYYGGYDIINAFLSVLITSRITNNRLDIVGFVISYYMILRVLLEIPVGKLLEKQNILIKRNIVSFCYIIYGILIIMMGFSNSLFQVIILQTGIALMDATAYPIKWTIFSKLLDKNNEEIEWGLEDISSTLVTAICAGIGGILSNYYGIHSIFIVFGIMFILSGITFFFIKPKRN